MPKTDADEQEILEAYEQGQLESVASKDELARFKAAARATAIKDRRVNIRLSSADLQDIQAKALERGIPYQTLIASVLHKYVTGQLAERPAQVAEEASVRADAAMTYYHDQSLGSAKEFVDFFLRNDLFRIKTKFDANQTGKGGMIFRGQSDTWRLRPSAFRPGSPLDSFTPQPPYEPMRETKLHQYLGRHMHAEARAIFIFLEAADALGITTPIDYTTTRDGIEVIEAALRGDRGFNYGVEFPSKSFQRATALAQHHGVPTRFLDWSESPLVASYFAAYGVSSLSVNIPRYDQEIAVYFMPSSSATSPPSPVDIIRAPRHENSFLRQQLGIFTNHRDANQQFLETGTWPALEDLGTDNLRIHRVRLPATQADAVLRELFDLGVTRQSLMPSLSNAASGYAYARALFDNRDPD